MATGFTQRFKGKITAALVSALAQNWGISGSITASATQTRVGGTPLTYLLNVISTVATIGNAVTLKPMIPGDFQVVFNRGANAASVFPNSAAVGIDAGGAGAAATLSAAKNAIFWCLTPSLIVSTQIGPVSA